MICLKGLRQVKMLQINFRNHMILSDKKYIWLFLSILSLTAFLTSFGLAGLGNELELSGNYMVLRLLVLLFILPFYSLPFVLYAAPISLPSILFIITFSWLISHLYKKKSSTYKYISILFATLLINLSILLGYVVAMFFSQLAP